MYWFVCNVRLAESKARYDHQREKYENMIENKRKEFDSLEKKFVVVCVHVCVRQSSSSVSILQVF